MSALTSTHHRRRRASWRYAAKAAVVTSTGAAASLVLAGLATPAAAASVPGNCAVLVPFDSVTCVYGDPSVSTYALRVPVGVTEVHIEALGGSGGAGGAFDSGRPVLAGAYGGLVSANFPVAAGDVLRILVGGRGADANGSKPGPGGLNGGAKGGAGALGGGGGGGASSVRLSGQFNVKDHDPRILVAGGGGGSGGAMPGAAVSSARGGAGGGEIGGNGGGDEVGRGGVGATGPSGGAGLQRLTGQDGHSGDNADRGGNGGAGGYGAYGTAEPLKLKQGGTWPTGPVGAGGGGGGWGGGGGGAAGPVVGGGGGGGSGFVATSALAPSVARLGSAQLSNGGNDRGGDGRVVVTYRLPAESPQGAQSAADHAGAVAATTNERKHP
ncbi:MAG: glycine-rich protein [Sporichthyaceae bacterium]